MKKQKTIKAWIIADHSNVPLSFGAMPDGVRDRLLLVYQSEEAAKKQWNGFNILPVKIHPLHRNK